MVNEQKIERDLIGELTELKYIHRPDIRDKEALERNFREKFQALNRVRLTDAEFSRLRDEIVNPDVFVASKTLRERNAFTREDGTPLFYTLVNIKEWCKNDFEVVNQLRMSTDKSHHRYDVILLINGLPMVQLELKTLDVTPRRAMQQIMDYKADPGNGYNNSLMCFIQLFIVSNHSAVRYFANNRAQHFNFSADEQFLPVYQYADINNQKPKGLHEFAKSFLAKCTLAETISRYMVLVESEQRLLVMRPYQIYAVKAIVDCIHQNRGNGYIWHTTGSGKTLTSFKASTLLKDNPDIEKCLFVVDRKDLDRQTREEFNRFQEGCVEENTNTGALVRRLLSTDYADKVIVTTIQKLGIALDPAHKKDYKAQLQPLSGKRVVFIFDECHRSQFGDNHQAIKEFFPNAQLFGFTGTPIFEENANYTQVDGQEGSYRTTEDIFEKRLHAYTITHAIEDKNVLRFHVDYFKPDGQAKGKPAGPSHGAVVDAILNKHDAATHNRRFNAVLATQSINDAIAYYDLFKKAQKAKLGVDPDYLPLNVACVFSPPAEGNKDVQQLQEDLLQEKQDNQQEPEVKKGALKGIIADYNTQYSTNHSIGEFDQYYQDVQQRIKAQKWPVADYPRRERIDIIIVVDMLLTGFDSKYLNTLYVDKNLKHHGLIQAFSRTNRVLNDTKPYGNVLDFRQQQPAVDAAIALFSGVDKDKDPRKIWLVEPANAVLKNYEDAVQKLTSFMEGQGLTAAPEDVVNLRGDAAHGQFVETFKEVQRLRTQLDQYTDLSEPEKQQLESLLPTDNLRAYRGQYLEVAKDLRYKQGKGSGSGDDEGVGQLDFEFVLFASAIIDYDYIMGLMAASTTVTPKKEKMTREQIIALLGSSSNLMDEADDLADYFGNLPTDRGFTVPEIRDGFQEFKQQKTTAKLAATAEAHGLTAAALTAFVDGTLRRMIFDSEALGDLLAPLDLGWKARTAKETELLAALIPLLKEMAHGRDISGLKAYELSK
jgi:type I restriction enzyme R subunit